MDPYSVRFFSSVFSSREMERSFRSLHHNPENLRITLVFAVLVYCSYILLDSFLFPGYFRIFLIIRAGIFLPVSLVMIFFTYTRIFRYFSSSIIISIAAAGGGGIITMEYLARYSPYAGLYFYGIAQILMFFYGTGKISLIPSVITGTIITAAAIIIDSLYVESDLYNIITKSVFLITMTVIGIVISAIIQYTARNSFINHLRVLELSITDQLTGLKNRLFFDKIIRIELIEYIKLPDSPAQFQDKRSNSLPVDSCYGLFMLDIDHFKFINDTYGHDSGDRVLVEFCSRIHKIIRSTDYFIRWGGEEFLLIIRHTHENDIRVLAERIKKEISETPFLISRKPETVTVSGGILIISPKTQSCFESTDILLELADKALYRSKRDGRNRFTGIITKKYEYGYPEKYIEFNI